MSARGVESVARQLREAVETAQAPLPPLFPVSFLNIFFFFVICFSSSFSSRIYNLSVYFNIPIKSHCFTLLQPILWALKDGRGRVCARASESAVVAARELGGGR